MTSVLKRDIQDVCIEERQSEDRERQLSASQGKRPQEKPNMETP